MLPLLLAALPGVADMGIAAYQSYEANQLAKKPFTPYSTPQPFMDYVNNAKIAAASSKMPGQSRTEDMIGAGVSNTIKAAGEAGQSSDSILATAVGANANENTALNDVGTKAATFQQDNMDKYNTALQAMSAQKDKEYETNIYKPYMAQMAAASALRGGAIKNATTGLDHLSTLGVLASGGGAVPGASTALSMPYKGNPTLTGSTQNPYNSSLPPTSQPPSEMTAYIQDLKDQGKSQDEISQLLGAHLSSQFSNFN